MSRLERQRRATRLDTWIDDEGMWCLRGRFDPETGLTLQGRLANTVAALFADKTPDDCPFHPLERQAFLRAHALAALTEGHGTRSGAPRSSPSSISPTPSPTGHRPSTGGSPSSCPPRCCAACSTPPTSTRSSCAAAWSSTPPAASTWPHHPGGQPGPTPRPARPLPHLRHPRLRHPLRPLPAPPHHLVGTRRQNRPRQPPALVRPTPPRRPRPRLAPRPGRRPVLDHHLPRRHHRDHRPTPTTRSPPDTPAVDHRAARSRGGALTASMLTSGRR